MSSRRYYTTTLPVAHINGKMAPVDHRVNNVSPGETPDSNTWWYGYRWYKEPNISRYGIRTQHRMLAEKPYTAAELENRTLFTMSLQAVQAHRNIAADWALCLQAFSQQTTYYTAEGFAVATCRANNGQWPAEWTAE